MNKLYVILPLAGLVVFGGFYWRYQRHYEARVTEERRLAKLVHEEDVRRQLAAQALVVQEANAALELRKQERAAQAQLEATWQQARFEAEQSRTAVLDRERKLRTQIDHVRTELEKTQNALTRIEERKHELERERLFLAEHVKDAESNRATFYGLVEKLEAVESRNPAVAPTGPATIAPRS